jgi:hypothetical protein
MYIYPTTPDTITDDNYREIADELLKAQCRYASGYCLQIAEGRWSDDDTDYFRTCLNVTERLMDIVYDGNRSDLITFLFSPRDDDRQTRDTLADMISAGGLCDELNGYETLIYEKEDANA